MKNLYSILQSCCILNEIPIEKYNHVFHCLNATYKKYERGTTLIEMEQNKYNAGILLDGALEEVLSDADGKNITIRYFKPADVFGAELSISREVSKIYLRATSDCAVLLLDFENLLLEQTKSCPFRMQLTTNLMKIFAEQILTFNTKVNILGKKRLREKIQAYLQSLSSDSDDEYIIPLNRNELAEYMCVDRSALSRELSKMREEGIIIYSGKHIKIIDKSFLCVK